MQIHTNSWHHGLYRFSFFHLPPLTPSEHGVGWAKSEEVPKQTNLCDYFWRVTIIAPFKAVVLLVLGVALACAGIFFGTFAICIVAAIHLVGNLFTVLLGFGVFWMFADESLLVLQFRIPVWGEKRFLAWFLVPFWILITCGVATYFGFAVAPHQTAIILGWIGWVIAAISVLIALLFWFDSVAWHLTKEFVKAKKAGFCPLVEFVDSATDVQSI